MKFHVLSDTHLETYREYPGLSHFIKRPSAAQCLCLCGDIGDPHTGEYAAFLRECARAYTHTFVVHGNHEVYGSSLDEMCGRIRMLCAEINDELDGDDRIVFLDSDVYELSNLDRTIRVLGTTLWSEIAEREARDVACFIADFREIKGMTIDTYNSLHRAAFEFIEREVLRAKADGAKLVIMTHHPPASVCGNPIHRGSPLSSAFKSSHEAFIEANSEHMLAWFYGHDHYTLSTRIGRTLLASNQAGYSGSTETRSHEEVIDV